MSFNKILKRVPVGSIIKDGRETLSVATETSKWIRPESIAKGQGSGFKAAVEASKHLVPQGTKDVCQRETEHDNSPNDPRDHYTGVCFNESDEGKSVHFPVKKD